MAKYNIKITGNAENVVRGDNVNVTIHNGTPPKGFKMPHIPTPEELGIDTEHYTDSTTVSLEEGTIQVQGRGAKIYKNGKRIF